MSRQSLYASAIALKESSRALFPRPKLPQMVPKGFRFPKVDCDEH
jgi:hypothetical protein